MSDHIRKQQVVRSISNAIRSSDPAGLLNEGLVSQVANGLQQNGFRSIPPLLGSEIDGGKLVHLGSRCHVCGGELGLCERKAKDAKILHTQAG